MLTALILVCSLATTPDVANCDMTSAISYERAPEGSELPYMCMRYGEQWYATEHGAPAPGQYVRVVCSRSNFRGRMG